MQRFHGKLPKDDLKKFTKECSKKLVASDFKNKRVEDPTKITEKQEKKVKSYVKEFLDRAVEKKKALDKKKAEKDRARLANGHKTLSQADHVNGEGVKETEAHESDADGDAVDLTPPSPSPPDAPQSPTVTTPSFSSFLDSPEHKRKRDEPDTPGDDSESNKRVKEDETPPPPPPPPPPPAETMPEDASDGAASSAIDQEETEEQKDMREQEEALMRENEQAAEMEMNGTLEQAEQEHFGVSSVKFVMGLAADSDMAMEGVEDTNGLPMRSTER